ncbi:TPA: S26 family signal peptidase [Aeromonas dhakensis]|uniref:S26 family signal peptidase n=1 Tax=Aeromonas dhakensis TaxID=196024 RepID=UPI002891EC33|nr:S26 family signal peptidase [Aeromonas dhakensis]
MEKVVKKNNLMLMAAVIPAALVMTIINEHLVIPISDSVNPIALLKFESIKPKKGDYVTFELENSKLKGGKAFLTKRIGCVEGDRLENRNGAFFCNNSFLAIALEKDGYGRPLSQFKFNGIIPENRVFMIGDDPRSYDSRYWGLTSLDGAYYSLPLF